ncbi:hypothetical protein CMV_015588 [Castanea mollissima]|uniref:Ribosomal protein 50S-L18Ae/60S-L20/60S-L18A domain-containing protein n=1 Tax=Castanea mollissima TaxID=60419 RepID=A0A8J4VJY3_9ROSI|nr:hypothetical protein CMV_015588 [Castanea mollissima]
MELDLSLCAGLDHRLGHNGARRSWPLSRSWPQWSSPISAIALAWVWFHQYQVVGRALPTESDEHPKIYSMKLWATNDVHAKSKFWYFLRKLKKFKKSNGQMLAINEIFKKNPTKKSEQR